MKNEKVKPISPCDNLLDVGLSKAFKNVFFFSFNVNFFDFNAPISRKSKNSFLTLRFLINLVEIYQLYNIYNKNLFCVNVSNTAKN